MRRAVASFVCVLLLPATGAAQAPGRPPRRPALPAGADTNSAAAYYSLGSQRLRADPELAADAFWWAARLDPETATYPYARWVALIIKEPRLRRVSRLGNDPSAARARALDSLMIRAMIFDPFFERSLDESLFIELMARAVGLNINRGANARENERILRQEIQASPAVAAEYHYTQGRFDEALALWGREASESPRNAYVRAERARAFYLLGRFDSASAQMSQALEVARRRDADSTQFYYESKAAWEFSLGRILVRLGDKPRAREAFENALVEDLSYYPAHIQLGLLHVERGDTVAGLREFERAVMAREDEYLPRVTYAFFLANNRRLDSAAVHLRRAIELEPWAAPPRLMLGSVLDGNGDATGALAAFEAYIARAPRTDLDLAAVRMRVAQLRPAPR